MTRRLHLLTLLSFLLILFTVLTPTPPAHAQSPLTADLNTGYVIVSFHRDASETHKTALHRHFNAQVFRTLREKHIHIVRIHDRSQTQTAALAYASSPFVNFAESDALMPLADSSFVTNNDSPFTNQWHHENIQSPYAWAVTTGQPARRITICDTGVSATHPDLQASLRADLGYNTADNAPGNWGPVHWHGTSVAGSAAAIGNNGIGIAGVSWAAEIVPVRITNLFDGRAYVSDMADCIVYGADLGSDAINLSYQTYSDGAIFSTIISAADYANSKGSVLVIAAGNDNTNPAPNQDPDSIVYVAATTSTNQKASFSNYGNFIDIAAPGQYITTTYANISCTDTNQNGTADPGECEVTSNSYASVSGTSFASPITAGGILLVRSINPTLSPAQTRSILFQSATDLETANGDFLYGAGLLNVHAAVHLAQSAPPPPPSATITVTTPNDREDWPIGSTKTIRWTSTEVSGNVNIQLSRNAGSTWTTLFSNVSNSGAQSWTVTSPATTQGRIRVTSVSTTNVFDISDANFAIVPSLTVTAPNGGENWAVGSIQKIRWTSRGLNGNVKIDLSRDGGETWTTLFSSVSNSGSYNWKVTSPTTTKSLIRITSLTTPTLFDVSDTPFTISSSTSLTQNRSKYPQQRAPMSNAILKV